MVQPNDAILIRATVIRSQEGVITAHLEDGFGRAEVVVHEASVIAFDPHKPIIVSDPIRK